MLEQFEPVRKEMKQLQLHQDADLAMLLVQVHVQAVFLEELRSANIHIVEQAVHEGLHQFAGHDAKHECVLELRVDVHMMRRAGICELALGEFQVAMVDKDAIRAYTIRQ